MIITSLKNKFHFKKFLNKFTFDMTRATVINIVAFCLMMPFYFTFSEDFVYNNNLLLNIPLFILFFESFYCGFIYKKSNKKPALYGGIVSFLLMIIKLFQNEIIINSTQIANYLYNYFYILFLPFLFLLISIYIVKIIINNQLQEKIDFFKKINSFPATEIALLIIVVLFKVINQNYLFIYFFDEYLCILLYLLFITIYNFMFLTID